MKEKKDKAFLFSLRFPLRTSANPLWPSACKSFEVSVYNPAKPARLRNETFKHLERRERREFDNFYLIAESAKDSQKKNKKETAFVGFLCDPPRIL
jgi:hypothetical protein